MQSRKRHIYVAAGDLYADSRQMRYILAIVRMRYDINPFAPAGYIALFDITRLRRGCKKHIAPLAVYRKYALSGFISLSAYADTNRATAIINYSLLIIN